MEFPQGMLTEFYPPVRTMTPPLDLKRSRAVLAGTSLDWGKLRITPASMAAGANVPKVKGDGHYAHARATDAAIVRFSDRPGEVHEENFLFYRGLGNFSLPVQMTAAKGDHFRLHNHSGDPWRRVPDPHRGRAFGLDVPERRQRPVDEAAARAVGGEDRQRAGEGAGRRGAVREGSPGDGEDVGNQLVRHGRHRHPAAVHGAAPLTDYLLPLRITPTPDETVRVLVGRIDILTPEQEAKLAAMLPHAGKADAISREEASRCGRWAGSYPRPSTAPTELQGRKLLQALYSAADGTLNGG